MENSIYYLVGMPVIISALTTGMVNYYLQRVLHQKNLIFSKVYDKKLEVFESIYEKLSVLEEDLKAYAHPVKLSGSDALETESKKKAYESANNFRDYFLKKAIWFQDDILNQLEEINKIVVTVVIDYQMKEYQSENWKKCYDNLMVNLPASRDALKNKFRQILEISEVNRRDLIKIINFL